MTKGVKAKIQSPAETKSTSDVKADDEAKTTKKDLPQDSLEEVLISS